MKNLAQTKFENYCVRQWNQVKAGEKRAMMTYVWGEAWEEYCGNKYRFHRYGAFFKTGLLLGQKTTENDNQIKWERMEEICLVVD